MQQRKEKDGENGPGMGWVECAFAPEITVMAASCLWQDLREGLGQAELICNDLLENRRDAAWCGLTGRQVSPFDLADLPWRSSRRGGEEL